MGATAREEGVLKLVHPGRHVEIHLEPISAAEIMRRNPRHSVARPDVFECPFVVVRPESMLLPGKVFLIVPNRTIYKLTKEYESRKELERSKSKSKSKPVQPGNAIVVLHQPAREKKPTAGVERVKNSEGLEKPVQPGKAIVLHQPAKQKSTAVDQSQGLGKKNPVQASCWHPATASPEDRDLDKRVKRQSQVGCWPETIAKDRNYRTALRPASQATNSSTALVIYSDARPECKNQVAGLKPCLRQHGSNRKHDLRVTFVLPNKDE